MNASRAPAPKPPEKGSFPLDHGGECKTLAMNFQQCLKDSKSAHAPCKHISKMYLECRMQKGLMQKEDLNTLGFHEGANVKGIIDEGRLVSGSEKLRKEGFVGGVYIKG